MNAEKMFRCNSCGASFENPAKQQVRPDNRIEESEVQNTCPACGDNDYEELQKCRLCDTYILSKDDYCTAHKDSVSEWMLDALERIQATTNASQAEVLQAMAQWIELQ